MCGWQIKLCDPLVTHGPYLSTLDMQHDKALHNFTLLYIVNRTSELPHAGITDNQLKCIWRNNVLNFNEKRSLSLEF